MKKDNIQNTEKICNLSELINIGLNYLEKSDFSNIENGRYEILGDKVFASVQDYLSKPKESAKFEAHRKYIDIQYIVKGEEQIGVCNISNFNDFTPYDSEKDIVFLTPINENKAEFIRLKEKEFMILMPQDAHMPSIAIDKPSYVKKVVVKVSV